MASRDPSSSHGRAQTMGNPKRAVFLDESCPDTGTLKSDNVRSHSNVRENKHQRTTLHCHAAEAGPWIPLARIEFVKTSARCASESTARAAICSAKSSTSSAQWDCSSEQPNSSIASTQRSSESARARRRHVEWFELSDLIDLLRSNVLHRGAP